MNRIILSIGIIFCLKITGHLTADWDYEKYGEDAWFLKHPACNGFQQSPIDILTSTAKYDTKLKPFKFINYDSPRKWKVVKTGYNIGINNLEESRVIGVNGSDLSSFYKLVNVHVHWGHNDYQGSEHRLNGKKMPLELHAVHASDKTDKYVVTGLFFQISNENNPALEPLIQAVDRLKGNVKSTEINFNLFSIYPKDGSLKKYYRYQGSLTTPPCNEVVIWNVFETPINISSSQMEKIREVGPKLCFRTTQNLYGRAVYSSVNMGNTFFEKFMMLYDSFLGFFNMI